MAEEHGMSQVIQLYYDTVEDVEFLSDHVESISASFRVELEPNEEAKMFGERPITEFSEELFLKMAWAIKDATFPFSLMTDNADNIDDGPTKKTNMNRECLFIDERRFGIDVRIWKFQKVRFEGQIDEVLSAIEAVQHTLVKVFAKILPNYVVGFGDIIMENMTAGFKYGKVFSDTQLQTAVRDFSARNPEFKEKSILSHVDCNYVFTYEVVTKKIDESSKNAIKVPRINIGLDRCQIQGALPLDRFLQLYKDLTASLRRVSGDE